MTNFWQREHHHFEQVMRIRKFYDAERGLTFQGERFIEELIRALALTLAPLDDEPFNHSLETSGITEPNLAFSYAGADAETGNCFVCASLGSISTGDQFCFTSFSRLGGVLAPPSDPYNFALELTNVGLEEVYICKKGELFRNGYALGELEFTPGLHDVCTVPRLNFEGEKLHVEARRHNVRVEPLSALRLT